MASTSSLASRRGLADETLLRTEALVGGAWRGAESRIDVRNPATGALLCSVPSLDASAAVEAVEAAARSQADWAATPPSQRSAILRRWYDLMVAHTDDLARILTAEQGKPLAEARGEARRASRLPLLAHSCRRSPTATTTSSGSPRKLCV